MTPLQQLQRDAMSRDFQMVLIGVFVGMALLLLVLWLMARRREKSLQEAARALEQPARQVTDAEYQAELASYGLFDYCPKCGAYQGCEGDNECIACGYTARRMVALDDVIARLEQGFGKGCAPVTTLLHHFGQAETAAIQSAEKKQN